MDVEPTVERIPRPILRRHPGDVTATFRHHNIQLYPGQSPEKPVKDCDVFGDRTRRPYPCFKIRSGRQS